uniref:LigA n=1 Tax=Parastrongyloides trichosuri TaxID=131310 RepID=A0A0N5A0T9_PARTI
MADQGGTIQARLMDVAQDFRRRRSADAALGVARRRQRAKAAHGDQVHPVAVLQRVGGAAPDRRGRGQAGDQHHVRPLSARLYDDARGLKRAGDCGRACRRRDSERARPSGRRGGRQAQKKGGQDNGKPAHGVNLPSDSGETSARGSWRDGLNFTTIRSEIIGSGEVLMKKSIIVLSAVAGAGGGGGRGRLPAERDVPGAGGDGRRTRSADARLEPALSVVDPEPRDRFRQRQPHAAVRAAAGRGPLQADQRHPRPPHRRRGAAPGGRGGHRERAPQRFRLPLWRRGVPDRPGRNQPAPGCDDRRTDAPGPGDQGHYGLGRVAGDLLRPAPQGDRRRPADPGARQHHRQYRLYSEAERADRPGYPDDADLSGRPFRLHRPHADLAGRRRAAGGTDRPARAHGHGDALDHYRFGLDQSELRSMVQINHLSEYLGSHAIACEPISL